MASITEGAKARQEAMAMELKFHQDKLKQLTGLSTSNNSSRINKKDKLYELGGTLPDSHYKWDRKKTAEGNGNEH